MFRKGSTYLQHPCLLNLISQGFHLSVKNFQNQLILAILRYKRSKGIH